MDCHPTSTNSKNVPWLKIKYAMDWKRVRASAKALQAWSGPSPSSWTTQKTLLEHHRLSHFQERCQRLSGEECILAWVILGFPLPIATLNEAFLLERSPI